MNKAVIFDIDGTIAIKGERDIYDGGKAHLDTVNEPIAQLADDLLCDCGYEIIFVSGRFERHRKVTEDWIKKNMSLHSKAKVFLRKDGDMRKDVEVKAEIYNKHIKDKYTVHCVFDDRNQTVKGWRDLGLTCLQVAGGDF